MRNLRNTYTPHANDLAICVERLEIARELLAASTLDLVELATAAASSC
jgi:hypothetical protein